MGRNEIKAKLSFPDLFFSGGNAPRTLETGSKRGPLVLIMKLRCTYPLPLKEQMESKEKRI